jgi:hypothetical protein
MDVSSRGILATATLPPKRGEIVEIAVGSNRIAGQVKWASERRFGVLLRERVDVAAMIGGGRRPVALQRKTASARRRAPVGMSLSVNSQWLARMGQFGGIAAAALAAALLIAEVLDLSLQPVQEAVAAERAARGS